MNLDAPKRSRFGKYLFFAILSIVGFLLLWATGVFSNETKKPSEAKIAKMTSNLALGSFIFNVKYENNGSQSKVDSHNIYRVTEVKGDYVFVEQVFKVNSPALKIGEFTSYFGYEEYKILKQTIQSKNIAAFMGEIKLFDKAVTSYLESNPQLEYFYGCSINSVRVFSKRHMESKGELQHYQHNWTPPLELYKIGYIDSITMAVPTSSSKCPSYGNGWLPDSLK